MTTDAEQALIQVLTTLISPDAYEALQITKAKATTNESGTRGDLDFTADIRPVLGNGKRSETATTHQVQVSLSPSTGKCLIEATPQGTGGRKIFVFNPPMDEVEGVMRFLGSEDPLESLASKFIFEFWEKQVRIRYLGEQKITETKVEEALSPFFKGLYRVTTPQPLSEGTLVSPESSAHLGGVAFQVNDPKNPDRVFDVEVRMIASGVFDVKATPTEDPEATRSLTGVVTEHVAGTIASFITSPEEAKFYAERIELAQDIQKDISETLRHLLGIHLLRVSADDVLPGLHFDADQVSDGLPKAVRVQVMKPEPSRYLVVVRNLAGEWEESAAHSVLTTMDGEDIESLLLQSLTDLRLERERFFTSRTPTRP